MKYPILTPQTLTFFLIIVTFTSLTACEKNPDSSKTPAQSTASQKKFLSNADTSSGLAGCYTTMKTEPAQIKINEETGHYTMQMREFNDPNKPWDKPEPMQVLPKAEIKTYFEVDEKSIEQAIIRPDKVFALAKIQDSLMNLDKRFDSKYLGYIAKSETSRGRSTTVFKIECGK